MITIQVNKTHSHRNLYQDYKYLAMTPQSVLYRLLTDEPDYEGIVNNFIDHVRCRPEESQA